MPTIRARRLETKRARFTETISEESSDQKERRLQVNRLRIANARNARFTNWENSAFSYSPTIKYQTQPLTQIGSMTEICQSCSYRPICYWSVVFALIYPAKRVIPASISIIYTRNRSLSNIGRARCAAINSDLKKIIISKYINYTIGINDNNCVFVCNLILGW